MAVETSKAIFRDAFAGFAAQQAAKPASGLAPQADTAGDAALNSKMNGRASTVGAGGAAAAEEQYGRGLLSVKKRAGAASASLLG